MTIPYIYEALMVPHQSTIMMPPRKAKQTKKDDVEHEEHKKSKKGKVVSLGRTMGRDEVMMRTS